MSYTSVSFLLCYSLLITDNKHTSFSIRKSKIRFWMKPREITKADNLNC